MSDDSRSSRKLERRLWLRFAMPSAADLIFVALLCALVFTALSVRLLGDAGIGWHIRTGQLIVTTHSVPRVDSFSSTMAGKPWFAWEWMYDLLVGLLEAKLGLNGVVWFTALVIAGTFAGLFQFLIARGTHFVTAIVLLMLALLASMIHFFARPHVVSWFFAFVWFWVLDTPERNCFAGEGRSRPTLWALPPMMLVWVNVHGGFLVGFVLLIIFLAGAAWAWFQSRNNRIEEALQKIAAGQRLRTLAGVAILSAVASLVNPYGWKLYLHIYHYLSNRFLMDHIDEFRSPNFHGLAQKCFLILLLISLAVLIARGRKLPVSHALVVLFTVYSALYAARNIPVSSILLVMVVGPLVPASGFMGAFAERMASIELGLRGHLWPALAALFTLAIAANGGRIGSSIWMDAHFDPKRMPVNAVTYLEHHRLSGPVLSEDYWGGYLIYRLYPHERVVLDDRHDLYGEAFFSSYLKMVQVERGWQEFLDTHEASCVLLPRDAGLTSMLLAAKGWKQIYADDVAIVFVREPQTHP